MFFECSKEPSHWLRNKKIIFRYTLLFGGLLPECFVGYSRLNGQISLNQQAEKNLYYM